MSRYKRYTTKQIITILKEIDHSLAHGSTLEEAVQSHGITLEAYYLWRGKYGRMTEAEITELQVLQAENAKLKRLLEMWVNQV